MGRVDICVEVGKVSTQSLIVELVGRVIPRALSVKLVGKVAIWAACVALVGSSDTIEDVGNTVSPAPVANGTAPYFPCQ